MSLIICPDCGKEVSTSAVACPSCGHPISSPTLEQRTVVREVQPAVVERDTFPKWIFIPLGILGVVLIFLLFALFRQEDNTANVNVDISAKRPTTINSDTTPIPDSQPNQIDVPPSTSDPMSSYPQTIPAPSDPTVSQIPADVQRAENGTLSIEAKVADKNGDIKPVKAEKFYLLDKDLETILNDADIKPLSGQTLKNSFGISVLYPDKYRDVNKKALDEINKHIKYDVTTDSTGKAQMKDIKPDSYYLFAITKTGNGFAIWSSPIIVSAGEKILNLTPPRLTEVQESNEN